MKKIIEKSNDLFLNDLDISNAMNMLEAIAAENSQSLNDKGTVPNTPCTCAR